jgi:hypothetical protein
LRATAVLTRAFAYRSFTTEREKSHPDSLCTYDVIKSLLARRPLRIAAFAVAAVAVAASAVALTASAAGYSFGFHSNTPASDQPSNTTMAANTTASKVCSEFMGHFAGDLGVSQDKLNAAFQQALAQTLADEVSSKHLTQAQADAIKQKLAGKAPCTLATGLGKGHQKGVGAQYTQALVAAAASALGITPQQLQTDLKNGMTLSQIAAAQKPPVTEAQFRAKLIASLKPLLDQAVTDKKLTSAQEQKILQRLQTGPIPFWDKPMKPSTAAGAGNS